MERQGSLSRRTRSAVPMVRVTSMPDVKGGMRPAGSCVSVESSGSGRTGVSYRVHPNIDNEAVVEVRVNVTYSTHPLPPFLSVCVYTAGNY